MHERNHISKHPHSHTPLCTPTVELRHGARAAPSDGAGPGDGAELDGRVRLRTAAYGSVVLHVEEEEKVDAELETMASAMVASVVEGVEVVWWRKCEEEEEGEGEEYEYEEEFVDDEEFEPIDKILR